MENKQHQIKILLDKLNVLYSVFEKEGIENISSTEKQLLQEQAENLVKAIAEISRESKSIEVKQGNQPTPVHETLLNNQSVISKSDSPESTEIIKEEQQLPEKTIPTNNEVEKENTATNAKPAEKLSPIISNTPLRNMKEIIDLNKSFIFKQDLFHNDVDLYNSFITNINEQSTEQSALETVLKYAERLGWDKESKTFMLLQKAVEKRFLPLLS